MPQTLNDDWMKELGDSYDEIHQTWLHTLGNLTLSAYNPELSNKSFAEKKETYNASNLELNRYVSKFNKWNQDSIQQRAQVLADRAVNVWPRPD
jgi:hypothetical protein